MTGFWKRIIATLPWLAAGTASTAAPAANNDDAADALWQQVYAARESYYIDRIGAFPDDILKMGNMIGVWPGGGLYVIPAKKIGTDAWVYTSFGLSNPDMPASVRMTEGTTETDRRGRVTKTTGTLASKPRAAAPDGAAGYGYEVIVLARENAQWPLWILQWAVNAEILNDAGILARVDKYDGLTIDGVQVGEDEWVNLLFARARAPLPTGTALPNGRMDLLIATVITDEEMEWSIEHGRGALLDRLVAAGVGQYSDRGRAPVIE